MQVLLGKSELRMGQVDSSVGSDRVTILQMTAGLIRSGAVFVNIIYICIVWLITAAMFGSGPVFCGSGWVRKNRPMCNSVVNVLDGNPSFSTPNLGYI